MTDRVLPKNGDPRYLADLLQRAALIAGCCVLAYGGIGLWFGDWPTLAAAGVIAVYTLLLLVGLYQDRIGQVGRAAQIAAIGLVIGAILLALLQPTLWACYSIVPLLSVAILLQFVPDTASRTLVVCAAAITAIVLIGVFNPLPTQVPALFLTILRSSSLIMTACFLLLLLWQFRSRLFGTMQQVQLVNAELAAQAGELTEFNALLTREMDQTQALLNQVLELEAPVSQLAPRVLYAALHGHLTAQRAEIFRTRAVAAVHAQRARYLILDISGITTADPAITALIIQTVKTVKLLGAATYLCGIRPDVALSLVVGQEPLAGVRSVGTPQDALEAIQQQATSTFRN